MDSVDRTYDVVLNAIATIKSTTHAFEAIETTQQHVTEKTQKITTHSQHLKDKGHTIDQAIDVLNEMMKQNTDNIVNIASSIEQINSSFSNIMTYIEEVGLKANELTNITV